MPNIGGGSSTGGSAINGISDVPGLVAALAAKIEEAQLAAALAGVEITQEVVTNIVNDTFVTQVAGDTTFITQLFENTTYVTNLVTALTELTEITQNTTYVTNLVTQITNQINGKKGQNSGIAGLTSSGLFVDTQYQAALKAHSALTPAADRLPYFTGSTAAALIDLAKLRKAGLSFVIEGGGAVIATGFKGFIEIPYDGVITAVRLLADQSGSIVVDIWKDTYANYPPVVGDSITASAKPTLSSAAKSQDTTLSGWTTAVAAGDILGFNVDSVAAVQRVTVALALTRGI